MDSFMNAIKECETLINDAIVKIDWSDETCKKIHINLDLLSEKLREVAFELTSKKGKKKLRFK